jgi:chitinase
LAACLRLDLLKACLHVQELKEAYHAESAMTGRPALLLTAAVAAGKGTVDTAYDIAHIAR